MKINQSSLLKSNYVFSPFQVGNYRSALTVRPHTNPELPGTEFCLTGFEDPGVQLPETIITWVWSWFSLCVGCLYQYFCCSPSIIDQIISRSQWEGCQNSCLLWGQLAWSWERRGKTAQGKLSWSLTLSITVKQTPKIFLEFSHAPLFSTFLPSWGRQEDNFGQIHQLRQQQHAAYAWHHSQTAFSFIIRMTGLAPLHHMERIVCKNLFCVKKNRIRWCVQDILSLLAIVSVGLLVELFKRAGRMIFCGNTFMDILLLSYQ